LCFLFSVVVWCWYSVNLVLIFGSFSNRCKSELERSQQAAQSADVSLNPCSTPQKVFTTPLTPSQHYIGKHFYSLWYKQVLIEILICEINELIQLWGQHSIFMFQKCNHLLYIHLHVCCVMLRHWGSINLTLSFCCGV
jgi:hypothetical protein